MFPPVPFCFSEIRKSLHSFFPFAYDGKEAKGGMRRETMEKKQAAPPQTWRLDWEGGGYRGTVGRNLPVSGLEIASGRLIHGGQSGADHLGGGD